MTTLQQVRGIYERVVIDAAGDTDVFVDNVEAAEFDARNEYCLLSINFGMMQELNIGCEATEFIRGSLVCEIYTAKGAGPGRGLAIAQPIILALSAMNAPLQSASDEIIARTGAIVGPRQASRREIPHHFTGFSCPLYARVP
jgi:hypothetical protein